MNCRKELFSMLSAFWVAQRQYIDNSERKRNVGEGRLIKSLYVGLKRRWRRGVTAGFSAIGIIWLLTEIGLATSAIFKTTFDAHREEYLLFTVLAAVLTFLWYIYEPRDVEFKIPTTSTKVLIKFGDIFDEPADWIIAVNEFFDHQLGQVIAPNSVHGQLIQKAFSSDADSFRLAVDQALARTSGTQTARAIAPTTKYETGTTAVLALGSRRAYLVALTQTDLHTSKASTSVPLLWTALTAAWRKVHDVGNGQPIALPLIGNGRSSLNLEPQHLLRLLVLSLVDFARRTGLPEQVTIVVPDACFEALDIREIARDWRR